MLIGATPLQRLGEVVDWKTFKKIMARLEASQTCCINWMLQGESFGVRPHLIEPFATALESKTPPLKHEVAGRLPSLSVLDHGTHPRLVVLDDNRPQSQGRILENSGFIGCAVSDTQR